MHRQCIVENKPPHQTVFLGLYLDQRLKLYRRKTNCIPKMYGSMNPASNTENSRGKVY